MPATASHTSPRCSPARPARADREGRERERQQAGEVGGLGLQPHAGHGLAVEPVLGPRGEVLLDPDPHRQLAREAEALGDLGVAPRDGDEGSRDRQQAGGELGERRPSPPRRAAVQQPGQRQPEQQRHVEQVVVVGEAAQQHDRGEAGGRAQARSLEVLEQREQAERKEELRLDLQPRDFVDEEGMAAVEGARHAGGGGVARQALRQQEHAVARERQERKHEQVVGEQRVARKRSQRPRQQRGEEQVLRERERVVIGHERRKLEKARRRPQQCRGAVRRDEAVEQGIALVAHARAGVARERIRREDRQARVEEQRHDASWRHRGNDAIVSPMSRVASPVSQPRLSGL